MRYEKIHLFSDRPWVTLEYIGNDLSGGPRDAILVIPGGGYTCVCSDREGYPIAAAYYGHGLQTFVLTYSVGSQIDRYTRPLEEAAAAMVYIREHAEQYGVGRRVFTVGFSAGGHLAAWLATGWKTAIHEKADLVRPDGAVLCYAVMHEFRNVLKETCFNSLYRKEELTREELEKVELDRHIDADTCPLFFMHTYDDDRVPVMNALLSAEACAKAGVPFEMHIYPHAHHGLALGNEVTAMGRADFDDPQLSRWVADSRYWMKKMG